MRINLEEQLGDPGVHPETPPFKGHGTLEDPFRPAAFTDIIQAIAQLAKTANKLMYCSFEDSNFCIHPDGTVEWAHQMPALRDQIAGIIEDSLRQWREKLS
jgi:hypothetical protein